MGPMVSRDCIAFHSSTWCHCSLACTQKEYISVLLCLQVCFCWVQGTDTVLLE